MSAILTLRMKPPRSCNYSGMTPAQIIKRRKVARMAVFGAVVQAAADRRATIMDLPRQVAGERWRLEVVWRATLPPTDHDNAVAALKPYVDALVAPRGRRKGGIFPLLEDDSIARLGRPEPLVERVESNEEELIFEFHREVPP